MPRNGTWRMLVVLPLDTRATPTGQNVAAMRESSTGIRRAIYMLIQYSCCGTETKSTLLISGGDVRQGCEASADYSAYGNRIVEDLELLGMYRRNSHKTRNTNPECDNFNYTTTGVPEFVSVH
jgi:hypothetical protein